MNGFFNIPGSLAFTHVKSSILEKIRTVIAATNFFVMLGAVHASPRMVIEAVTPKGQDIRLLRTIFLSDMFSQHSRKPCLLCIIHKKQGTRQPKYKNNGNHPFNSLQFQDA